MIKPEDIPYVVPTDIAVEVKRIGDEIDRSLIATGGTANIAVEDHTDGHRVVGAISRLYKDAGYTVTVESDPHNYTAATVPLSAPWHFHVLVSKAES